MLRNHKTYHLRTPAGAYIEAFEPGMLVRFAEGKALGMVVAVDGIDIGVMWRIPPTQNEISIVEGTHSLQQEVDNQILNDIIASIQKDVDDELHDIIATDDAISRNQK